MHARVRKEVRVLTVKHLRFPLRLDGRNKAHDPVPLFIVKGCDLLHFSGIALGRNEDLMPLNAI